MFWNVLSEVITPGLGAALSPMLIVAATILAGAEGGARKAFIFAFGDFLALAGVGVLAVLAADGAEIATSSGPSKGASVFRLIVGIGLWVMAWQTFQKRPAAGETPPVVKKLNALDQLSPGRLLLMGVSLGLLNAKNLPLTASVAAAVGQQGAQTTLEIVAMLIFAGLGASAVLAPGVIAVAAPKDAERVLGAARNFFVTHNTPIMMVLFIMLGGNMIGASLSRLLA